MTCTLNNHRGPEKYNYTMMKYGARRYVYSWIHLHVLLARNVSSDNRDNPMFADTLCFRTPAFFTDIIILASENMFFGHPLFSDTPYF